MVRSDFFKFSAIALLFAVVFGFGCLGSAQAQATFQVSGASSIVTKIGQTELLGNVTFTVVSGTTQNGTIEFFVPNVIVTNDAGSGITLSGTGGLAGATIAAVVPTNGIVIINVVAGAGVGSSVTLSGVRIAAAGKNFTTLDASVSSSGNSITAGQNLVRIVRGTADGLAVTESSQTIVTVSNGVVVTQPASINVSEGWERAFSSAIGVAGQDTATQVIFKVTGLPDGVTLTFPGFVTSDSGATLVTMSASPEDVTNQSNPASVVYVFNDSGSGPGVIDTFAVKPVVSFPTGNPGTGTAVIQAALGPIGAAIPDSTLPSTAIPRFAELFLPPLSTLPVPPATNKISLGIPGSIDDAQVTFSNTGSGGAIATVRARRADGSLTTDANVTNEVSRSPVAHQTTTLSLKDLFGPGATIAGISSIEIESSSNALVLNSIGTAGGQRFANSRNADTTLTYIPFDRRTSTDIPTLTLNNMGSASSDVILTLRSSSGGLIASAQRTVVSLGAVREGFSTLFPAASLPLEGYLVVQATLPVRPLLLNNPASRPDEIPTLLPNSLSPTVFPFFVFGAGYSTALELINPSDTRSVQVTLTAFSPTGAPLSAQPFVQTLAVRERQNFDFASIFGTGSQLGTTVGYFSLAIEALNSNPFQSPAQVFGILRFGTSTASSVIPFVPDAGNQLFLSPATETSTVYTGLAMITPSGANLTVTVEAFSSGGTSLGTVTFTLNANTARIQLLRELLPQTLGNDNMLVRISTTGGTARLISFRGTLNQNELIYLKGETAP